MYFFSAAVLLITTEIVTTVAPLDWQSRLGASSNKPALSFGVELPSSGLGAHGKNRTSDLSLTKGVLYH